MRDLANLDLMRSFAVILVVLCHVLYYAGSPDHGSLWFIGVLGVFLFFTHTTLVLMWSLERDPHPLRFYVRRAFRIYPLWLVVLFVSVAVELPTSPVFAPGFGYFHAHALELFANATLTFNLLYGCRLIGASWSLPIEVQMYVVLPFLFFFMRSYRRIWPLLLLDILVIATAYRQEGPFSQTLLACTPLFLPGAMAYLRYKRQTPHLPAWSFVPWLVGTSAVFNAWASHAQNSYRSGWIFALVIGTGLPFFRQITWSPLCRVCHLVARYSYGIYLCHFAAIAVGIHYLRSYNMEIRVFGFLATLTVLSVAAYHLIEKPLIVMGSRLAKRLDTGPEPPVNEQTFSLEPAP